MFYEMFLVDANGDLIDVPVLLTALVDEAGEPPNTGSNEADYVFVR